MISNKILYPAFVASLILLAVLVGDMVWPCIDRYKVRLHYRNEPQKLAAAEFLLDNMDKQYTIVGDGFKRYDTIFTKFEKFFESNGYHSEKDPMTLQLFWDSVEKRNGPIADDGFLKRYDTDIAMSDIIIDNIDAAFEAWQSVSDSLVTKDFRLFCEYVLPYRIGTEKPEKQRRHLLEEYRGMRDTMFTDIKTIEKVMNKVLRKDKGYSNSELMWRFAYAIPANRMEKMRRGSCMHICEYYVQVLRALGIPATIDEVYTWGNRAGGHCWVTVMKDSTTECAFDPLTGKNLRLTYRPIKIYRRTYKTRHIDDKVKDMIPDMLANPYITDVSNKYFKTHTIRIKAIDKAIKKKNGCPEYALICCYDNLKDVWVPVDYGRYAGGETYEFKNIIGDQCAIMAFYDKKTEEFVAASQPFTITDSGKIEMRDTRLERKRELKLTRKYPRFKRMSYLARKLHRTWVEGADNPEFRNAERLMTINDIPGDINDSVIMSKKKYRYIRWTAKKDSKSCLAEILFYGKHSPDGPETLLKGNIIGSPEPTKDIRNPYWKAIDGNPATYFEKKENEDGYVGIDLGKGNEAYLTRVKYFPRSDTNYIIPGDTYELCYWDDGEWKPIKRQKATDHELTFKDVPDGALYILRDLTRGKEVRPFTYEDETQRWW